jgi:hypothetical protein
MSERSIEPSRHLRFLRPGGGSSRPQRRAETKQGANTRCAEGRPVRPAGSRQPAGVSPSRAVGAALFAAFFLFSRCRSAFALAAWPSLLLNTIAGAFAGRWLQQRGSRTQCLTLSKLLTYSRTTHQPAYGRRRAGSSARRLDNTLRDPVACPSIPFIKPKKRPKSHFEW